MTINSLKHGIRILVALLIGMCCLSAFAIDGSITKTSLKKSGWDGPIEGPAKQTGKKVTFITQDSRNGGVSSAYRGFYLAAIELGWSLSIVDGKNDRATIRSLFSDALQQHQDAIILGGIEFDDSFQDLSVRAKQEKIILVGWHASAKPGPTKDLFVNITTPYEEVGKRAAEFVIDNSKGEIGVIIFNDDRFGIANAKTAVMMDIVIRCARCKLLSVENMQIGQANQEMPGAVIRLNQLYGKKWTHTLAINDAYFDAINVPLARADRRDIQNVSAGDGSYTALSRIKSGISQQVATVAEPFGLQGWQLADELNRAFSGWPPSGYISKPIVITSPLMNQLKGAEIDSILNYKENYSLIWTGKNYLK
ncbi:substrate-binding domain-containing protein [Undibacterium sp. Xuan67W]|uniref:substrate-binding domain-containing protein n=1 Tax=Undibacterium sp. Xuan67W TaxID=3413057 RepID=UPI003BF3CD57